MPKSVLSCRVCECTDDRACATGCAWVPGQLDLCTNCEGTDEDLEQTLNAIGNPKSKLTKRDIRAMARAAMRRRRKHLAEFQHG